MTYNKKPVGPIVTFVFWLVCLIIICIVGISNVFAASYDALSFTAQLYDNYGPSLSSVTTSMSNMYYTGTIPTMTANSSGAAWGISSPVPLLANHTYSMTVRIEGPYGGNIRLSTYNRIGVGTSLANAKTSYENNTNVTENYSNAIASNMALQFAFTPSINATYIVFPFATTYTGNNQEFRLYNVVIDDLGTSGVSQSTINNSLNNQTNILNNSITNSENNIKNKITNTESNLKSEITNSENNIKDGIKDGFESCRDSYNLFNPNTVSIGYLLDDRNGNASSNSDAIASDYIEIKPNTNYYITRISSGNWGAWYDENKNYISGILGYQSVVSPSNAKYMRLTISYNQNNLDYANSFMVSEGSTSKTFEKYGEKICSNRIDDTNKKLDEQNETSKGILGKIKDILSYINPFSDNFFGKKLVELIINGLKSLFIPDDDFFSNWWTDFKSFMEAKLGFLTKPIDIFITFISSYLNLSEDNIIINIPNITVPNYEDTIIIKAQTFNWKSLLQSKTSLNLLWQLYLDFIDVFLIFNFIGLCEVVYARIFGGDTSAYEYYTVEDSYYFDSSTGEVANTGKHSERTVTKRKKV